MTDKQIIIDGVDVSGCPYYIDSDGSCSSHDCECIKCIHNECFYKDYKCKEQECERLEEANNTLTITREKLLGDLCIVEESLEDYTEHYNRQSEEVDQLKSENEELKKEIINRNEKIEELRFSVSDLTNRLCDLNAEKSFRIVDLEQTLAEIKQYCTNLKKDHYWGTRIMRFADEILQKINEAINE